MIRREKDKYRIAIIKGSSNKSMKVMIIGGNNVQTRNRNTM